MSRATNKTTTIPRAAPGRLATVRFADQLNRIAGQLDVVAVAIFGINEISTGDPASGPLISLVQDIGAEVRSISRVIHRESVEAAS